MLYIISGTSRGGKSIIAKKILEYKSIPYMSIDWMVMGFTNGIPEFGIHDKLWPHEIADKVWNFLKAICENIIWSGADYVLEGEAVLPELITELTKKYPDKLKVCFVGYTNVDIVRKVEDIKKYSSSQGDWLSNESDEFISRHVTNMISYSKRIANECQVNNQKYIDTSNEFERKISDAVNFLISK